MLQNTISRNINKETNNSKFAQILFNGNDMVTACKEVSATKAAVMKAAEECSLFERFMAGEKIF